MMINPGPSDSSAVFALLTAISNPEAAKASIQEILDASEAYQKTIEDFRTESKKTKEDLDAKAADADDKLAEATKVRDDFNKTRDAKLKQLSDISSNLDNRRSVIDAAEADLSSRSALLASKEQSVSAREGAISSRENAADKLNATALAMKDDYESKLSALKAIL